MSATGEVRPVQVAQQEVTIPARPVRAGRLPVIGRLVEDRPVYPYRLLNELDFDSLAPRTFRALVLENEHLRLTVLPELGGRLHRALYKPAGYDLFYYNDAIRSELVGSRGAWYAGGVEFNFPISHSLTTQSGVDHRIETYPDGSAAVLLANTCRVSRMRWRVAIRLVPGSSVIHFRTRLFNRTAWPQRYYYWLNASVPQGPQIRYHFSASRLVGHLQETDGVQTRLDRFPMLRDGSDARVPAKLGDTTSIFMLDNHSGFFGYYDLDADLGLVRSAPVRNVPGNKIWSWGDTDYGRRFNRRLVPPGGQFYGELQSGRPESQTDWAVIEPFELIEADEFWYPVPRLGGMSDGGPELAVFAEPRDGRVRLVANRAFEELAVRVRPVERDTDEPRSVAKASERRPLAEQTFRGVRPGEPIRMAIPPTDQPISIVVAEGTGRVVFEYADPAEQADSVICDLYEHKAASSRQPPRTAAALTTRAASAFRAGEQKLAEQFARAALARDEQYGAAHRWWGLLLRPEARWQQAADQFKAALLADTMDYAAYYYYAAVLVERGWLEQAALELERVIGYAHGQHRAWSAALLARCLLALGRTEAAGRLMEEWPGEVAFGPLGRLAYQVGLAPDGRSRWWNDPTDLLVGIVESPEAAAALDAWWAGNVRLADEAADAVIEVAEELLAAGDVTRAAPVLAWLVGHPQLGAVCPTAHYRLGEVTGDLPAAVARAAGVTDRARMAWPARFSDERLLAAACRARPDDALAHSLTGMLKLWLGKADEAVEALDQATQPDGGDALAWRNLGLARWTGGRSWQECLSAYERAVALWPDYAPLVGEADRLLADLGAPLEPRRRLLYEDLHASLAEDSLVAIRRARLALATGDYAAGIEALSARQFHPAEAGFGTQRLFMRLNTLAGERLAGQGDWAGALACFRRALEYPESFGIGRPRRVQETRQRYLAALALEHLGDASAARAELDESVTLCLRSTPVEAYFGILALRKLGRDGQAEQWLGELAERADARRDDPTPQGQRWGKVFAAVLARARGDREQSSRLLEEIAPKPEDPLADLLTSKLY